MTNNDIPTVQAKRNPQNTSARKLGAIKSCERKSWVRMALAGAVALCAATAFLTQHCAAETAVADDVADMTADIQTHNAPAPQAAHAPLAQSAVIPESRAQITMSYAPLVRQVAPAVVNIYTKRVVTRRVSPFASDPFFQQFFGESFGFGNMTRRQVESALGSGVIVEADGLIVTNAHVIADAEEITVVLPDGREFDARKVLVDEPSDLALLRVDAGKDKLPSVTLRASEMLEVGDLVLAIGNPFGVGQTVTGGIVSAQARSSLNINDFNFFIQTDAAINPGNSGGPLVAMDGGVIGINTAIFSRDGGSLGIGFAIPSEMVATLIAAEKSGQQNDRGGIARAWLGISGQKITADIAESLGLDVPQGVLVADMHSASPARAAGLQRGDVITALNGRPVREPAEMRFRMATIPLGEKAEFATLRQGKLQNISVQAIAPPDSPSRDETVLTGNHPLSGATVVNINPAVIVETGVRDESGVIIAAIDRRGHAVRFVAPGDVVLSVNGRAVADVDSLVKMLTTNSGATGWNLMISRDGRKRQIVVR